MNQLLKTLSVPVLSVFLAGGVSFAQGAQPMHQPQMNHNNQQQQSAQQPNMQPNMQQQQQQPQSNVQQQHQQTNAQQKNMQSITGKVTSGGGLIAQNGQKFRLNGAKAARLRHFTNQTVTIKGYRTQFEGHNAIVVESFQPGQSQTAENNMRQPNNQSNFRSQPQGQQAPQPGQTGYKPEHNQQQQGQPR
ncbi:MAG: hypothetical protein ACP5SH_27625 [Syntrophobacteraceae bacterium]